ncbi:hypothetical protein K2X89_02125, partial [Myxococcota bacterium]|nr:hypothetical protein [Myxococcota bacterium]
MCRAIGWMLACVAAVTLTALAASAQSILSLSPDVTVALGAGDLVTPDHAVVVDNQLGVLALQNLGVIPD